MQKKAVSLAAPVLIGIMALALGWFAHAALPLAAQGIVMDGRATRSDPTAPAAPALAVGARLTYQGRLTASSGTPMNGPSASPSGCMTVRIRKYTRRLVPSRPPTVCSRSILATDLTPTCLTRY